MPEQLPPRLNAIIAAITQEPTSIPRHCVPGAFEDILLKSSLWVGEQRPFGTGEFIFVVPFHNVGDLAEHVVAAFCTAAFFYMDTEGREGGETATT